MNLTRTAMKQYWVCKNNVVIARDNMKNTDYL